VMDAVDQALRREFEGIFGATQTAADPLSQSGLHRSPEHCCD